MASGLARGAAQRGRRIAFGDGRRIIWDHNSAEIFRNNPNIAPPGSEGAADLEWVDFYKGNRRYNTHDRLNQRWIWSSSFRPVPGEIVLDIREFAFARQFGAGFVIVEPNVPAWKTSAPNKQWPVDRYAEVTRRLVEDGYDVRQFDFGPGYRLPVKQIATPKFRLALAVLRNARLFIGPEGGMHHGAAAVGVPGVVIFGGFIPPRLTGYDMHTNIAGSDTFCGSLNPCQHCRQAMDAITVDQVYRAATERLKS